MYQTWYVAADPLLTRRRYVAFHLDVRPWRGSEGQGDCVAVADCGNPRQSCDPVVQSLKQAKPVRLFEDQFVSPTLALNAAQMLAELGRRRLTGIWHTADVPDSATAVFITAGRGTQHRMRS